ncbi:MAG TPA: response regulator [Candidatus Paceibacterota bacterium]|nr:response regulator [Verrucomicrobiota bacterium]HSA10137.1 response regulator [Candidatus Paceibacterota bacterium]
MPDSTAKRKTLLFVDDEQAFLASIQEIFSRMAHGNWDIHTAQNHAQALALLDKQQVDVVVLDIGMPGMDGIQFLQLLGRTHPGQQVAMLTGRMTEENRKESQESGALLFLEKPITPDGFASVFAALDALAGAQPQTGFRGMMRRVGLHEVLQVECLGRKSSVLEIFTGKVRGRIFISDGAIVHAESGTLGGEMALYGLLALRGGEFNLLPYAEPPHRTIEGQWESLLMEAARLSDEGQQAQEPEAIAPPRIEPGEESVAADIESSVCETYIQEIVLCSGTGEVLYEWQSKSLEQQLYLLEQLEQHAAQVGALAPVGRFDRLEILAQDERIVCQVLPDRRVWVRSVRAKEDLA